MDLGAFIPIGSNRDPISMTAPCDRPMMRGRRGWLKALTTADVA
jgi:hypothetical protein